MPSRNVRRAAVSALQAWARGHLYAESLIDRHARRAHLSTADRALLNGIVLGVLRNRRLLDHWIARLRRGRLDRETRDILRVGLCQLLLLDLPEHAAVNESVSCARSAARGLVNAVLRRAAAARQRLLAEAESLDPPVRYSHPDWLWKAWRRRWGSAAAAALLAWNNRPAPVFLRENPLAGAVPFLPRLAEELSLTLAACENAPGFHRLDGPIPSSWIEHGLVYAQDPSTRHAVELLAPRPGETVLDACAAPGGKAALIAAAMHDDGRLLCTDGNERRLPRLEENLRRLRVTIAETTPVDWTNPPPAGWRRRFDAILLDVPCSNTGVLRRRVDARWRLAPDRIEELQVLQSRLLDNALPCLKPGGRLVYSTCSLEPGENQQQIEHFLGRHRGLDLARSVEVTPMRHHTDGAYAALVTRNS